MSCPHIQHGRLRRRPLRRSASRRSAYCLLSRPLTGIGHRLLLASCSPLARLLLVPCSPLARPLRARVRVHHVWYES